MKFLIILCTILSAVTGIASANIEPTAKNGDFEKDLNGWRCDWFIGKVNSESHSGGKSVKFVVGSGNNMTRLQQTLKLEKDKEYEITFWTKGKDSLFQIVLFWGPKMSWCVKTQSGKAQGKVTSQWVKNRFVFKAPQVKINLQLRASGKTGYVLVDDLVITPLVPDKQKLTGPNKPIGKKIDLSNWARIRSRPYLNRIDLLNDGNLKTSSSFQHGPENGATVNFIFPKPIYVSDFRFQQKANGVSSYSIKADTNGDGKYNKFVSRKVFNKVITKKWLHSSINTKVYGLEFIAESGKAGYRTPYPYFTEVEIYTSSKIPIIEEPSQQKETEELIFANNIDFPNLKIDPEELDIIICADFFMMGLSHKGTNIPDDLNKYPPFVNFVKRMKKLKANAVRFFPESSCCANIMPWPSKICPHIKPNLLKKVVDALHSNDIKIYMFLHAWIDPIQKRKGRKVNRYGYPYEESDRSKNPAIKYPCILSGGDFKNKWYTILEELAELGVDGTYIAPDEYYYKGHSLVYTKCIACQDKFKKMFGYKTLPEKVGDNEKYRKWKLYEYTQLARLFAGIGRKLSLKYPHMKLFCEMNIGFTHLYNKRMEHTVCFDIIANELDKNVVLGCQAGWKQWEIGSASAVSKRYEAVANGRKSLLQPTLFAVSGKNDEFFPLKYSTLILSGVMNGIDNIAIYRYNYIYRNNWGPYIERTLKFARLLQTWGVCKGKTAADTCVLLSRASEDWWALKMQQAAGKQLDSIVSTLVDRPDLVSILKKGDQKRKLSIERFRGFYANKCLEGILLENGIQYDAQFLDNPLANLKSYKLLIIPFGYSISKKSFAQLEKAAANGTKILVYDTLGETDEFGRAYKTPLLKSLLKYSNVSFRKTNLATVGMDHQVRGKNAKFIKKLLVPASCRFEKGDCRVEFLVNKTKSGNLIIMLANWDRHKTAKPLIGFALSDGNYKAEVCDYLSDKIYQAKINGKVVMSNKTLNRFNVSLAPGQIKLIHIVKIK